MKTAFLLKISLLLFSTVVGEITLLNSATEDANRQSATLPQPLPPLVPCDPNYPFRTYDGSCNNLQNPRFGQANTIFQRLFGVSSQGYSDGKSAFRTSVVGNTALPSARWISSYVTINESLPTYDTTLLTMAFGQLLDHDLALTPTPRTSAGQAFNCCTTTNGQTGTTPKTFPHPECMPIKIPSTDPLFKGVDCMQFIRSSFGLYLNGSTPSAREQVNSLTHWIDGSMIYGSSDQVAQFLRDKTQGKGLLKVSIQNNGRTYLPVNNTCCNGATTCAAAASCFVAGDNRQTEQPLLTLMHTLWVREHNRVAKKLCIEFPGNNDEFYYQQARRIVIAELQHIIYTEYLPVIIGQSLTDTVMTVNNGGPTDPAVYNEFATAAFRMGHSTIKSFVRLFETDGGRSNLSFFLSDSFANAGQRILHPSFIDNAIRGLLQTPIQTPDHCFADDITSQLFKRPGANLGLDLISLNLQRGRDHGIYRYADAWAVAQKFFYGKTFTSGDFNTLSLTTPAEVICSLKKVYASVYDIDLFIGGVTELPMPGALLGPTFSYIFARQFENLKRSDRFFYNDLTKSVSLTQKQLDEIKKVSFARIICDNNDGTVTTIQPRAFRAAGIMNSVVNCNQIPGIVFANMKP